MCDRGHPYHQQTDGLTEMRGEELFSVANYGFRHPMQSEDLSKEQRGELLRSHRLEAGDIMTHLAETVHYNHDSVVDTLIGKTGARREVGDKVNRNGSPRLVRDSNACWVTMRTVLWKLSPLTGVASLHVFFDIMTHIRPVIGLESLGHRKGLSRSISNCLRSCSSDSSGCREWYSASSSSLQRRLSGVSVNSSRKEFPPGGLIFSHAGSRNFCSLQKRMMFHTQ